MISRTRFIRLNIIQSFLSGLMAHIYCYLDSWASSDDVWIKMLNKELKYVHDKGFVQQHPALQPKMRSILLDWLIEVCLFSSTFVKVFFVVLVI